MANTASDQDDYSHLPKDWMDKQVGRSVYQSVTLKIERISSQCVYRAPAEVVGSFEDENVKLSVVWPFSLPLATGQSGDWPATKGEVERFAHAFKAYLAEEHIGWELAKFLHVELCRFLLKQAKSYRYAPDRLKKDDVLERLERFCNELTGHRFAGRREPHTPAAEFSRLKQEAESILRVVSEMQLRIAEWKKAHGVWDAKTVKDKLREEYDRERYPWMKYFGLCLQKLPRKANWKGTQLSIADPASWSAVDLARLVMKETLYHETGVRYPASEIRKLVKAERGRR
jgi:hypothetical protein